MEVPPNPDVVQEAGITLVAAGCAQPFMGPPRRSPEEACGFLLVRLPLAGEHQFCTCLWLEGGMGERDGGGAGSGRYGEEGSSDPTASRPETIGELGDSCFGARAPTLTEEGHSGEAVGVGGAHLPTTWLLTAVVHSLGQN